MTLQEREDITASAQVGQPAPVAPRAGPAQPGRGRLPGPSLFAAMQRLRKWSGVFLPSSAEMGGPGVTGLLLGKGQPGSEPKPPL